MTLLKCHIENLKIHLLGKSFDPPFTGPFLCRHAANDQLCRLEMLVVLLQCRPGNKSNAYLPATRTGNRFQRCLFFSSELDSNNTICHCGSQAWLAPGLAMIQVHGW